MLYHPSVYAMILFCPIEYPLRKMCEAREEMAVMGSTLAPAYNYLLPEMREAREETLSIARSLLRIARCALFREERTSMQSPRLFNYD